MITTLLAWLWAGLILGVSFVATPIKFLAPSLTLPVAMEIGRVTFHSLRWIECGFAVAVLIGLVAYRRNRWIVSIATLIGVALLMQYVILLPALDARVEVIIRGGVTPPSLLHWIYTAIEVAKAGLVALLGIHTYRHTSNQSGVTSLNSIPARNFNGT